MSSPIRPATASGCGKVLGSKMIEPSRRTQVSCGAPRLVTIGGRSTMVEGSAGDAPADDSAGLSGPGGAPARNASNTAPAHAPKTTTTANFDQRRLERVPRGGALRQGGITHQRSG